jgi:hypothetical protein
VQDNILAIAGIRIVTIADNHDVMAILSLISVLQISKNGKIPIDQFLDFVKREGGLGISALASRDPKQSEDIAYRFRSDSLLKIDPGRKSIIGLCNRSVNQSGYIVSARRLKFENHFKRGEGTIGPARLLTKRYSEILHFFFLSQNIFTVLASRSKLLDLTTIAAKLNSFERRTGRRWGSSVETPIPGFGGMGCPPKVRRLKGRLQAWCEACNWLGAGGKTKEASSTQVEFDTLRGSKLLKSGFALLLL